MRAKLTITLMLGLMTFAFVFLHPGTAEKTVLPPAPQGDPFLIGGLHNAADVNFTYTNTLNFNLWHSYLSSEPLNGKRYPLGWVGSGAPNDRLFTPGPNYVSEVRGVINNINAHDNMKVLLQRPKIEYLCYGQRSDYQCEPKSLSHSKWFYAFNDHETGALYTEPNGDSAIFCTDGNTTNSGSWVHNPGFVCKRLKANTEQSHRETGDEAYRWDSQSDWLIKPRIRIDSVFAYNPTNWLTPVCSITVKNQDGNTIRNVVLNVRNFLNSINTYDGKYKETYRIFAGDDTLIIQGDWGDKWWFKARGTRSLANESDTSINHADIQVYWYGNCDMWLDYVRVDNDIAHNLFSEDPLNAQHQEFERWLEWEAKDIACYNTAATVNFYIELVEFNNLPCIKYVNERLNYYKTCQKQLNVITDLLCFYQSHISWNERGIIDTPEKIKDFYMDYTGAQEIFLGDPYPLIARRPGCTDNGKRVNSQIPNSLPVTSGNDILANIVSSPVNYDRWLQAQLDTVCVFYKGGWHDENHLAGVFMYLMKNGHEVSKLTDKPFYAMLQAHQWIGGGEIDREPTVEEQDLMTNLAVSYGARGIIYWGGASFYNNDCKYNYAYWEAPNPNVTPRYNNVYGQPKWTSLIAATTKLKTWGPYLMSFNNADRQSYIYRIERTAMTSNTYFSDINTYVPVDLHSEDTHDLPEADSMTYIQAAVFKNNSEPGYYYFMIVNRRCSPYTETSDGGRRFISVQFDPDNGRKWEITELISGKKITVKRGAGNYEGLGWFMPGEGRLYKMIPAQN